MKKTLAILLAVLLTFSSVSLLGTGTALAEQQTGDVLFTSDFLGGSGGTTQWNANRSFIQTQDENGDGIKDFVRMPASAEYSRLQLVSPVVEVIPGNSYELSFNIRIPEGNPDFTYESQISPNIVIYQPTKVSTAGKAESFWSESQNEYAYSYVAEGTKTRRTELVSNIKIGENITYTRDQYSSYGYKTFFNAVGTDKKLNDVFGEWTKMTISFTAIASAENDGPQQISVSFGTDLKGTFSYDLKDIAFTCTNAVEAPKVQTILKSDFANGMGTWVSYKFPEGTVDDGRKTEDGETYVEVPAANSQTYLLSTPFEVTPDNKYEITFDFRIPEGASAFYSGQPYGPFFGLYQTGVNASSG